MKTQITGTEQRTHGTRLVWNSFKLMLRVPSKWRYAVTRMDEMACRIIWFKFVKLGRTTEAILVDQMQLSKATHCPTAPCEGCSTRLISKTDRSKGVLESLDRIATTSGVTAPVSNHATQHVSHTSDAEMMHLLLICFNILETV